MRVDLFDVSTVNVRKTVSSDGTTTWTKLIITTTRGEEIDVTLFHKGTSPIAFTGDVWAKL